MKSLLGRLSPRRAWGVYIGEDEIAVSQVSATVLGPVEIYQHREPFASDDSSDALARALRPLVAKRRSRRGLVAFALPPLRTFFSTRPLKATNTAVSAKVLLHEVLQSPNSNVDEMAIDLLQGNPGKRPVVSLVSCRKKYLGSLLAKLQECGIRPYQVEPAACGMLRVAELEHRAPRKAKTVLRLFLGEDQGLAVLSANGWPLVPRPFDMAGQDAGATIISNVRALDALGKLCGADSAIDVVLIHGRPELRNQIDLEALEQQLGADIQWHDGPSMDNGSVARGVAIGCLKPNFQALDLARSMKPRETIWEQFPWAEVALQVIVLACLGMFLFHHSQELSTKYSAVRSQTEGRHWLTSQTEQSLVKEKQDLQQRVEAIRRFLATRVVWTAYTHDIPSQLPANATLNSFYGVCELEKKGKKDIVIKPKKSFTMRIGAPIASDGTVPKEVDGFLDALRENALLKRDFPLVELADIKWYQPFVGAQPTAFFTVVCLPKTTGPGAPPAPAAEKTH